MPPPSLAQLGCPALSTLLPIRSAILRLFFLCVLHKCFNATSARERKWKVIVPSSPTQSTYTPYRACDARCTPRCVSLLDTHFVLVSGPWCCAALRYSFAHKAKDTEHIGTLRKCIIQHVRNKPITVYNIYAWTNATSETPARLNDLISEIDHDARGTFSWVI